MFNKNKKEEISPDEWVKSLKKQLSNNDIEMFRRLYQEAKNWKYFWFRETEARGFRHMAVMGKGTGYQGVRIFSMTPGEAEDGEIYPCRSKLVMAGVIESIEGKPLTYALHSFAKHLYTAAT